jgi:hypothetical protein
MLKIEVIGKPAASGAGINEGVTFINELNEWNECDKTSNIQHRTSNVEFSIRQ